MPFSFNILTNQFILWESLIFIKYYYLLKLLLQSKKSKNIILVILNTDSPFRIEALIARKTSRVRTLFL